MSLIQCDGYLKSVKGGFYPEKTCIETYLPTDSDGNIKDNIVYPEKGHVFGPWVAIDFVNTKLSSSGGGAAITVSNQSSESTHPKHCAVIKSFSLGHADGLTVRVVIHDTQGGSFEEFMKHMIGDWLCLKDPAKAQELQMRIQFGWVKNDCNNHMPMASSKCYYANCESVEANYTDGKFIFEITGKDAPSRTIEGSAEIQVGSLGHNGMYFLDAVDELMNPNRAGPNIKKVLFKKLGSDGKTVLVGRKDEIFKSDNEEERKKGKLDQWIANGKNKLELIRSWSERNLSIDERLWIGQYDATEEESTLVFWESNKPIHTSYFSDDYLDKNSLGTYIVNGSASSSVIEFNPKIRWDWSAVTGSGGNSGNSKLAATRLPGSKHPGIPSQPVDKIAGTNRSNLILSESNENRYSEEGSIEQAKQDATAKKTIQISHGLGLISADLVVIGDPNFCPPDEAMNCKNITIVLLNPFHIEKIEKEDDCGQWLCTEPCNKILSNKAWLIRSVNHSIDAGSYTTTIAVELTAPGVDVPAGVPLGSWVKGWVPPGVCP